MKGYQLISLITACFLAALAAMPWTVTSPFLVEALSQEANAVAGFDVHVDGQTKLALLPTPRLSFEAVTFTGKTPETRAFRIEVKRVKNDLHLFSLLMGRIAPIDTAFIEAKITASEEDNVPNLGIPDVGAWLKRHQSASILKRLSFLSSTLSIGEKQFTNINLVAARVRDASALRIGGSFSWREQTVTVSAALPALRASQASSDAVSLHLYAPLLSVTASGLLNSLEEPQISGTLQVECPSFGKASHWLGLYSALDPANSSVTGQATFIASSHSIALPSFTASFGSSKLDGALSLKQGPERLAFSGTVAADTGDGLALPNLVSTLFDAKGGWNTVPFDTAWLSKLDVDMRVSIGLARFGRLVFKNIAGSFFLQDQRLEASLSRAAIDEGAVKGRMIVMPYERGLDTKLSGSFSGLDVSGLFENPGVSGTGQGQFLFEGRGATLESMAASLTGKASVSLSQGTVSGIDLKHLLQDGATVIPRKNQRTDFETLDIALQVADGQASLSQGHLNGSGLVGDLSGGASLVNRTVDLLLSIGSGAAGETLKTLAIQGLWEQPFLSLNRAASENRQAP